MTPLEWEMDSNQVAFDDTIQMSQGFDWFGWEHVRQEAVGHNGQRYVIWQDHRQDNGQSKQWSAYGGNDGSLALHAFATEEEAKQAVGEWSTNETP